MNDITYECSVCGKKVTAKKGQPVPSCCRMQMAPLPYCTKPPDAENARFTDEDGPCDNGISDKKR